MPRAVVTPNNNVAAGSQRLTAPLRGAIETANPQRLLATLLELCAQSDEAAAFCSRILLSKGTASKRTRTKFEMCKNCKEEFDTEDNENEECCFPPETLQVDWDSDVWADHDEDCHGPIDSKTDRRDNPEGFIYDCCGEDGTADGCEQRNHEARTKKAKAK